MAGPEKKGAKKVQSIPGRENSPRKALETRDDQVWM